MADTEIQPIVVDVGDTLIRIGFAGDDHARVEFPMVLAKPRQPKASIRDSDCYVGDEAQRMKASSPDELYFTYPKKNGLITDWDDMEKIWRHAFKRLGVDPAAQPCIVTEGASNPRDHRDRTAQILFDKFNVPALAILNQGMLATYATGSTSGVAVYTDSVTHVYSAYQGFLTEPGVTVDLGRWDASEYLERQLMEFGYFFDNKFKGLDEVDQIKEHLIEAMEGPESAAELEGQHGPEIIDCLGKCKDVLFEPELAGKSATPLHRAMIDMYNRCASDESREMRDELDVALAGPNARLPGLKDEIVRRLLGANLPHVKRIRIVLEANAAWIGGSILGSLVSFQSLWTTREQFEAVGRTLDHSVSA